jgi:outer membrane protein TolC
LFPQPWRALRELAGRAASRHGLLAVALVCAAARAANGQEGPLRLTLEEAIARAEQNSLRVAELQARVDVAAAAEAGRQAASRPAIALLGGYTRTNHVDEYTLPLQPFNPLYPDVPDNYRARVDLQWPIYTAGRQQAQARAAGAERAAAGFDAAAARLDARLEASRAFWALVTATQTEGVVQRALDTLDAHLRDLRSRLDQGLIPPNDVLTAEAQRAHQQVMVIEARNLRQVAKADLRRAIGEDRGRDVEAAEVPGDPALPGPQSSSLETAHAQRPERRAIASRIEASREREAAASALARPQISLAGGYDQARPNPRIFPRVDEWNGSWDVSVNVSWSLWDGGRHRAEEAEAVASTRALAARSADFDRQLAFEIEQRRLDVDSAIAAIGAADVGIRAAQEAQRVVGERFTAGVATNTDVLDAQTDLLQAELDRTRAVAAARLAMARLDRAMGRP